MGFSQQNKAIIDSRLQPRYATNDVYLLIFIVQQNMVGINAVVSADTLSPLMNRYDALQYRPIRPTT